MVDISVIICTHNRADVLDAALASLARQTLASERYLVIVVDNASTDNTREVAEQWVSRNSNFKYVNESQLGLSHARNRGIAESQAPFIAFLDDDARAVPEWLASICAAFQTSPCPALDGGPVALVWEGNQPPFWMSRHLMHAVSYLDYGDTARTVAHVNGCNMAFDQTIFMEAGVFRSNLGRQGTFLLAGEESDLIHWAKVNGRGIYYDPHAKVDHFISRYRQTVKYFLRVYYGLGLTEGIRQGQDYKMVFTLRAIKALPQRICNAVQNSQPVNLPGILMIIVCEKILLLGYLRALFLGGVSR